MRYYIRHDKDSKVEGPLTVVALIDAVRAGRISPDALASSDLGEDISSLHAWRSCDWFPLAAIAGLRSVVPPLPEPVTRRRRASAFTIVLQVAVALLFSYRAITEQGRLVSTLAILMIYGAVYEIVYYVRQRETRSSAV